MQKLIDLKTGCLEVIGMLGRHNFSTCSMVFAIILSFGCDQKPSASRSRSVTFHAVNKTHDALTEVRIIGGSYPALASFGVVVPGGWASMSLPTKKLDPKFEVAWAVNGQPKRMELELPSGFDPENSTVLAIIFRESGDVVAAARPQTDGRENYLKAATSGPMVVPTSRDAG